MKITVHKMENCKLCRKCAKLLKHWGIPFRERMDYFVEDRPYPFITIELEYEECVKWIAEGRLK